ncbi:hypothetical protein TorRG33x02_331720 [Trema orientale]|uniref:Uncharacterized protein n=1 Tax=Trema orientale TaxID=63057 RepID=A0A2P5B5R2_TREOI|nr:hypothetical protein TorRG33x02_331720 [Trema orientale]
MKANEGNKDGTTPFFPYQETQLPGTNVVLGRPTFVQQQIWPEAIRSAECIQAEGSIKLSLTVGIILAQVMNMVDYLVVNKKSSYNAIIGKSTLNTLKAVISKSHFLVKFLIEKGIEVMRWD